MIVYRLTEASIFTGVSFEHTGAYPPVNTTTTAPPKSKPDKIRFFDKKTKTWSYEDIPVYEQGSIFVNH